MKLWVTVPPHVRSEDQTGRIMLDVVIGLLPAAAMGVLVFGIRALAVILCSAAAALLAEGLFQWGMGRRTAQLDSSALVTGLLLALSLPATVPYRLVIAGSVFAVVCGKGLWGGLGQNSLNPALGARAFLMLLWPFWLTRCPAPGAALPIAAERAALVDAASSATPLHTMQIPALPQVTLEELLLGRVGGCIGEVSALALLLGGGYLLARRIITWHIPATYLGTVALLTLVFHKTEQPVLWMAYSVLSGGVILGAFFMATDYASAPVTTGGKLLCGAGCGALTVLFRYFGLYPEGVTYAILLMNVCAGPLERCTAPRRFGTGKGRAEG